MCASNQIRFLKYRKSTLCVTGPRYESFEALPREDTVSQHYQNVQANLSNHHERPGWVNPDASAPVSQQQRQDYQSVPANPSNHNEMMFVCLFVFNVPSTARSFTDGTLIYCPLRRTWNSVNTPSRPGIDAGAVVWQSITLPLCHGSSSMRWRRLEVNISLTDNVSVNLTHQHGSIDWFELLDLMKKVFVKIWCFLLNEF